MMTGLVERNNTVRVVRMMLLGSSAFWTGNAIAQVAPADVAPALGAPAAAPDVAPQAAGGGQLGDIVVTATRRSTNVQKTPLSVTAVDGQQLSQLGITSPTQLNSVVPNVNVTQGYSEGNVRIAIRGMGLSDFSAAAVSPVALYLDDVYQAYTFGVGTQLFDLNRVEVLRGPQGTLFGKNATAGAVNYFSAPARFENEGYVDLDFGGGQMLHGAAEGMINRVLVPGTLAMRADFRYSGRGDYVEDLTNGQKLGHRNSFAGRLQFDWKPSATTEVNLKLSASKASGDGVIYHGAALPGACDGLGVYFKCVDGSPQTPVMDPNHTRSELRPDEHYTTYGATLRINQDVGNFSLTSITAYENVNFQLRTNDDGDDTDFFHSLQGLRGRQASQELRLASPSDNLLSGIVGLYGMYDHFRSPNTSDSTEFGPPYDYAQILIVKQTTWTGAAFGNATLKLSDKLKVIGGLRYSHERKSIDLRGLVLNSGVYDIANYGTGTGGAFGVLDERTFVNIDPLNPPFALYPGDETYSQITARSFNKLTYDATVDYQVTPNALLYARVAKGFRSGGFNTYAQVPSAVSVVQPETLMSYEAGYKLDLFDRHLRFNGDVYWYDYQNQQVQSPVGENALGTRLQNAGQSRIKGFELEVEAMPTSRLHLSGSVGYADAKYRKFEALFGSSTVSLAGNALPFAPKLSVTAGANYKMAIGDYNLTVLTNWSYRSRVYYDPFDLDITSNPPSLTGDLRLNLDAPSSSPMKWSASLYVKNITNHKDVAFAYFVQGAVYGQVYADLRTFGAEWKLRF